MAFKDKHIRLILSNYDIGAGKKGAASGPEALRKALSVLGLEFSHYKTLNTNGQVSDSDQFPNCKHIDAISEAAHVLSQEVQSAVLQGEFPLIFSGDHSNAIGGISGLKNAHPDKRIGVLWIDAHADLHSPYTTPSGNMHGMPLAALTSCDNLPLKRNEVSAAEAEAWNRLKTIGDQAISPKIRPEDLVFIGIRDAEAEEWKLIDACSIKTFEPDDIRAHGIYHVLNESIAHLSGCDLIYVSFDVDSLDPEIAVGTGTTAPDGLKLNEAEGVFRTVMQLPNLAAFEITEINPGLDQGNRRMADVVAALFAYGNAGN